MGRNSAIKRFRATSAGQPLELFDTRRSRLPVVSELRASPWIVRASDLAHPDTTSAARHVAETVTIEWDGERARPAAFVRAARRYRVETVVQVWACEKAWWDPRRHVSRRYWRVLSHGGVYDLAFDRRSGSWLLVGIQD